MEGRVRIPDQANPTRGLSGYLIKDSSNVVAVSWDKGDHMYVAFKSGHVYRYDGVSRQRAVATCLAASVGQYLARKIKPHYEAVRVM
jgi:hypothetical protein